MFRPARPLPTPTPTPQGFNPDVSSIRHTLDPVVPFSHRPLALYAAIASSRFVVRAGLRLWGFRRSLAPCGTFFYWFRAAPPSERSSSSRSPARPGPIVLFHGVGTGLPFYVLAIWKMCRDRVSESRAGRKSRLNRGGELTRQI